MPNIYANTLLTSSATSAPDPAAGIFGARAVLRPLQTYHRGTAMTAYSQAMSLIQEQPRALDHGLGSCVYDQKRPNARTPISSRRGSSTFMPMTIMSHSWSVSMRLSRPFVESRCEGSVLNLSFNAASVLPSNPMSSAQVNQEESL